MLRTIFVTLAIAVGTAAALRSVFYALLFYLWIAYFRPETWVWNDFVTGLNLSLIVGVYLLISTCVSRERFVLDLRSVLLFVFLAHDFLSTSQSAHFTFAWTYWQQFAKAVVITYLLAVLANDRERFRAVLVTIALSLGLEAAKQGWVQMLTNPGAKNDNELPFLGDNNGVAVGMIMLLPVLLALGRTAKEQWERYLYRFMVIGVAYRAITTYSRGGFLSAAVVALLYTMRSPNRLRAIAGTCLVVALIAPVLPSAFWERMSTITSASEGLDSSAAGRLHFWRVAVRMATANPLLGIGHYAYAPAYDDFDFSDEDFGTARAVHSSWFGVVAELGFVGLALFLAILALAFRACRQVRTWARDRTDLDDLGAYGIALETSLAAFVVGGSFVASQYVEMVWHFIGLTTALRFVARNAVRAPVAIPETETSTRPVRSTPFGQLNPVPVRRQAW